MPAAVVTPTAIVAPALVTLVPTAIVALVTLVPAAVLLRRAPFFAERCSHG